MAGDFARWAAIETAATLKHDKPGDFPFPLAEPQPEPTMITRPCGCTSMTVDDDDAPVQISWCDAHDPGYDAPPIPRPSDPFDCIQDGSSEYEGTILETPAERDQRGRAFPVADEDVTFPVDSSPATPLTDWDW